MIKVENPKEYEKSCDAFKDYNGIEEYIEDVVFCLVYSPWRYSEERARDLVKTRGGYIEEAYKNKEPANECSAEVGYVCG